MIIDDTKLTEEVTLSDIFTYMELHEKNYNYTITRNNLYHEIGFNQITIFRITLHTNHTTREKQCAVDIYFGSLHLPNKKILDYLGIPIKLIEKYHLTDNMYRIERYGILKHILQPYLRLVEKYKTTRVEEILLMRLMESEKMVESLVSGLCLSNNKVPNELICDIIET